MNGAPDRTPLEGPLAPGGVIGILGGGQLGRMLACAASELGFRTCVFSPQTECVAGDVASDRIKAEFNNENALAAFAERVDVATYEFENVPVSTARALQRLGLAVRPGDAALERAQDRLVEKRFVNELGVATAPFFPVDDVASLQEGLRVVGRPAILKTRRLGYDGKGQTRITDRDIDLAGAFERAAAHAWAEIGAAPSILEGFVPFTAEISVIGARSASGEVRLYDPPRNEHSDGILKRSIAPSGVSGGALDKARAAATSMLQALDYIGVIGVEFFVLEDDEILVNEFAPRVHNSGHWTQDACPVSQFEQHIRAVAGWPLGDPARIADAEMENLIGAEINQWREFAADSGARLHIYGKREVRPGRKMGHMTRLRPLSS